MHTLVNLTPHDIVVYDPSGKLVVRRYERSGNQCFVEERDPFEEMGGCSKIVDGIQVIRPRWRVGLTYTPESGAEVIVSQITAQYIWDNWHKFHDIFKRVYVPATDPEYCVRDDKGQIVGTKALVQWCPPATESFVRPTDPLFQGIFQDPAVRQQFSLDNNKN